jgi:hypothetical protein
MTRERLLDILLIGTATGTVMAAGFGVMLAMQGGLIYTAGTIIATANAACGLLLLRNADAVGAIVCDEEPPRLGDDLPPAQGARPRTFED